MTNNTPFYLFLNWIFYESPRRIIEILAHFTTIDDFMKGGLHYLHSRGISPESIKFYSSRMESFHLDRYMTVLDRAGIKLLTRDMTEYPYLLTHLTDPPPLLYYKGNLKFLSQEAFAIVGTRQITDYGSRCTRLFTAGLMAHFVIVSGMAAGVDTVAHDTCLEAGCPTIAVVGTGLDRVYPTTNRMLFERLSKEGLVLSEFPLNSEGRAHHFPQRNRIVSGIARGTLICEASEDSGSLITARLTAELGRDVFVIPGSIFSDQTKGNHALIRDGAQLVTSPEEILSEYSMMSQPTLPFFSISTPPKAPAPKPVELLTEQEKLVWNSLQAGPLSLDGIAIKTKFPVHIIMQSLSVFEIKQWVERLPGGLYQKTTT
jgi:DNA processing protein